MFAEAFVQFYQQTKLIRNDLKKLLNVNLTKLKINDNLFDILHRHNLFLLYSFSHNLLFRAPVSFIFFLNLRHAGHLSLTGKVREISSANNLVDFFV